MQAELTLIHKDYFSCGHLLLSEVNHSCRMSHAIAFQCYYVDARCYG